MRFAVNLSRLQAWRDMDVGLMKPLTFGRKVIETKGLAF